MQFQGVLPGYPSACTDFGGSTGIALVLEPPGPHYFAITRFSDSPSRRSDSGTAMRSSLQWAGFVFDLWVEDFLTCPQKRKHFLLTRRRCAISQKRNRPRWWPSSHVRQGAPLVSPVQNATFPPKIRERNQQQVTQTH